MGAARNNLISFGSFDPQILVLSVIANSLAALAAQKLRWKLYPTLFVAAVAVRRCWPTKRASPANCKLLRDLAGVTYSLAILNIHLCCHIWIMRRPS